MRSSYPPTALKMGRHLVHGRGPKDLIFQRTNRALRKRLQLCQAPPKVRVLNEPNQSRAVRILLTLPQVLSRDLAKGQLTGLGASKSQTRQGRDQTLSKREQKESISLETKHFQILTWQ